MQIEKISYQVVVDGDPVGTFDNIDKARKRMREHIKEIKIVQHHHKVQTLETALSAYNNKMENNNDTD